MGSKKRGGEAEKRNGKEKRTSLQTECTLNILKPQITTYERQTGYMQ